MQQDMTKWYVKETTLDGFLFKYGPFKSHKSAATFVVESAELCDEESELKEQVIYRG